VGTPNSRAALATAINVPRTRVERVARRETRITADTALRLSRYFGTTAAFWMNMQAQYDLEVSNNALAAEINKISPYVS
jgi:addiction module HigA family antidote